MEPKSGGAIGVPVDPDRDEVKIQMNAGQGLMVRVTDTIDLRYKYIITRTYAGSTDELGEWNDGGNNNHEFGAFDQSHSYKLRIKGINIRSKDEEEDADGVTASFQVGTRVELIVVRLTRI